MFCLDFFFLPLFSALLHSRVARLMKSWLWGHFWSLGQQCWGRQTICWIFALRPSGKQQLCVASSRTESWLCKWAENFRKVCACLWCTGHFFVKGPVNIFTPNFSFDEPYHLQTVDTPSKSHQPVLILISFLLLKHMCFVFLSFFLFLRSLKESYPVTAFLWWV